MKDTIFVFGAAEKGAVCKPLLLYSLEELFYQVGHPPRESEGIRYAIQALLFQYVLIYFRVTEEGFSYSDYMAGLKWIKKAPLHSHLAAISLPGVGDEDLLHYATAICFQQRCTLLVSEKDLYDYLTAIHNGRR